MRELATAFLLFLFLNISINSDAQTTYKSDSGYFGSIESLYFRGGDIESAQLIGPAFGYRFNETYDLAIHTEFLFSEYNFSQIDGQTSLLNLGLILGRTHQFTERIQFRSELSLYKSFNFNVEGFPEADDPSLTTAQYGTSAYAELPISGTLTLMPNIGGFLGYGEYQSPVSDADLTQAYDGFVGGPKLGLDLLFTFSDSFYMIVEPTYRHHFTDNAPYDGVLNFNFQFNF